MKKEDLESIVKESFTIHEVLVKLGKNTSSGGYKYFNKKIKKYEIDTSHFQKSRSEIMKRLYRDGKLKKIDTEDMFTENSTVSRTNVKSRILLENLIEYKCSMCGNTGNWGGKPITLILDHINGKNNDHRLQNLRFLCPNCNATLDTHCVGSKTKPIKSKKLVRGDRLSKRKVDRPDLKSLVKDVNGLGYSATGRKYGVSDNAIRKWIIRYKKINQVS
jgi:5-methylcytosine-specific restriction endonuclease McrA